MNDNCIVNSSELIMQVMSSITSDKNELPSIWKTVVSKVYNVGERLAGNTKVIDFKNGILLVEADHSGWIQYLRMYEKFILTGLNRALPELKINGLAYRLAGSKAKLSDNYDDQLKSEKKRMNEKINNQEKQLEKMYSVKSQNNDNKDSENQLPPELLEKFESLKKSMLTNSEK